MKKKSFILITILIIALLVGCTTDTAPEQGNGVGNENETGDENVTEKPDPIVSKEVPDSFPEELVPLYEVEEVEGVIAVGEDYHQAYYFSNMEREELIEKYREFYKDKDVNIHENEFSYELSGDIDGHKIRMYIMPYNVDETAEDTAVDDTTEENTTLNSYATTVIIFIYADGAINAG